MSIRLLTYNVRYATLDGDPNAWPERRDGVASLVRFHRPDVVCLQEVWETQLADLEARLPGYEWVSERTSSGEHTPVGYRADRLSVLDREVFSLSETPEDLHAMDWETTVPRVTTAARFRDAETGAAVVVASTHLDHDSERARREGAALLADRFGDRPPAVVAGDFNCTPDDRPYRTMTEAGFRDARAVADAPHGPETTFNDFEHPQEGKRIDHVFVSDDVDVGRFAVLADLDDRGLYPSDHFAVLADLELPP
ncbi:endonuclease/exonuclease/phosphatase family protein [Natronomonas marina]|jgi:endonuclease/exonuclease/phosphatase family metal-dependent hydrolase|uniref:endonuclease/exonuclease/phosphatase family protein n=1 Tax=Natronomonas marina TaxID=2961939 RepID=UPI0020C9B577|nr:endonuclease/exonuclease/phosphatase family protein [Natronomonas marina]